MKRDKKAKGAGMETQGRITAEEIRARVRGRLEDAARAEAKRKAAARVQALCDRFPAWTAKAEAAGELAEIRAEGENALADWTATLAGWTWERVQTEAEAAVADMGLEGRSAEVTLADMGLGGRSAVFVRLAAECIWKEARARVAWREYVRVVGSERIEGAVYDWAPIHGGEPGATLGPIFATGREAAETECERVLREATRNAMLEMKAAIERHAEESRANHAKTQGRQRGLSSDAARLEAFKRFEVAKKDEEGTQAEIAAGVLADMKEEGKDLHLDTRTFLNRWRDWTQMKRPEKVEEYRAAKDAAKKAKQAKTAKPKAKGKTGRGRRSV